MSSYNTRDTLSQDSLANMPSGMTFAQKARAAELNASKRRKAARETEYEVPDLAPVSLGALKFTKRLRGKGSQAKTLDDLTEEEPSPSTHLSQPASLYTQRSPSPQDDQVSNHYRRGVDATYAPAPSETTLPPHLHYSPPTSDYFSNLSRKVSTTPLSLSDSYTQWDPDMARRTSHGQYGYSTLASTPASSYHTSRQSPAMDHQPGLININARDFSVQRQPQELDSVAKARLAPYGFLTRHCSSPEGFQMPARKENVPPSVQTPSGGVMKEQHNSSVDDPFVNQTCHSPYKMTKIHKAALDPRAAVRMPPAVKGTLDRAYRFPSGSNFSTQNHPTDAHVSPPTLAGKVSKQPVDYAESRALNDPKAASRVHVRDPHPYTGFIAPSNKTDMLMQSLERLKMGDDSASARTVLYDPVAQSGSKNSSTRTDSTVLPSLPIRPIRPAGTDLHDFQRDLLRLSDPLPPMVQQEGSPESFGVSCRNHGDITENPPQGLEAQQIELSNIYQSANASLESQVFGNSPTQKEKDAALMAWFTGKNPKHEHMRDILERGSLATQETMSTPPQQRTILAPIGCGRKGQQSFSSNSGLTNYQTDSSAKIMAERRAANDIMAPVLANLHDHMANDPNDPFTRYAQPPAWCIDTTPGGNKSLMGETEWNPPPRVGRDPRYPTTFHEGRPTYFEEVGRGGGRR